MGVRSHDLTGDFTGVLFGLRGDMNAVSGCGAFLCGVDVLLVDLVAASAILRVLCLVTGVLVNVGGGTTVCGVEWVDGRLNELLK